MNELPPYLAPPETKGHTYGTVEYNEVYNSYIIKAEPAVAEMAKRVFPGSTGMGKNRVRFPATRRHVGELNWLMLRYPLKIREQDRQRFEEDRQKAIAHALRRDENLEIPPIKSLPPTFIGNLYPFQQKDISFLLKNERALLGNVMGTGKTVEALAAISVASVAPVLVVVQPNLQIQWRRMAGAFLDLPTDVRVNQQAKLDTGGGGVIPTSDPERRADRMVHIIKGLKPYQLPSVPVWIIHYGLLAAWKDMLLACKVPLVVFDEIQELRHPTTAKYSAASAIAGEAKYVWGLSGTPIYNWGIEIWSVLNVLEYHALGDKDSFTREWCEGYGQKRVENPEVLGDYLRREGLMIRRRLEDPDVRIHLPPKRRVVHVIDSDRDQYAKLIQEAVGLAHRYDQIKDWHEKGLAKRKIEEQARRATGVAKAPYVAGFVRTLLDAGERVLLCAHHHDVHDILAEKLADFKPVRISGRETAKEKDAALTRFAKGETNLVQLALRSSAGLDGLQGRGSCVVFAELDWSPAIHGQLESRLHRIGIDESLESVLSYYMVAETGSDETIREALGLKIAQFTGIVGDKKPSADEELLNQAAGERHINQIIQRLKEQFKPKQREAAIR